MKATIVRKETLGNLISGVFFGKCGKNMLADMRKTDFMKKKKRLVMRILFVSLCKLPKKFHEPVTISMDMFIA